MNNKKGNNPNGNLWRKDESRLGLKMMKATGWSPGKGLGANEDGCVDPIPFKVKKDVRGVGYTMKDDQWISHQDDFNALLSELNGGKMFTDKDCKPQRLEAKSKQSKNRVHFHKFARWKDLSCRSEQDIASILGKRQCKDNDVKVLIEQSEGQDMIQYFKQKMTEKKASYKSEADHSDSSLIQPMEKKLKMITFNEESNGDVMDDLNDSKQEAEEDKLLNEKKKRKKDKRKSDEENDVKKNSEVKTFNLERKKNQNNKKKEINEVKENGVEPSSEVKERDDVKLQFKKEKKKRKKEEKKRKKERKDDDKVESNENDGKKRKKCKNNEEENDSEGKDGNVFCEASSDKSIETEEMANFLFFTSENMKYRAKARNATTQSLIKSLKRASIFKGSNFFSIEGYTGHI